MIYLMIKWNLNQLNYAKQTILRAEGYQLNIVGLISIFYVC